MSKTKQNSKISSEWSHNPWPHPIYDENYYNPIPNNVGDGIRWLDQAGNKWRSEVQVKNGVRRASLETTSWVSVSPGAIHYYAKITFGAPNNIEVGKERENCWSQGGYGPDRPDDWLSSSLISVRRRLTKIEKNLDGEPIGAIGDMTNQFNTEKEAWNAGIQHFKDHFGPGWVLEGNDDETGELITLATT